VIFALFTEGLLKVCDKLSNPCSLEETSFSERVYGTCVVSLECVVGVVCCTSRRGIEFVQWLQR
jgi:hypothetical protein